MRTKNLLLVALGLVVSLTVSAQGMGSGNGKGNCDGTGKGEGKGMRKEHKMKTPEERAAKQTTWMVKDLGLTDEQKTKVEAINLEYAKKADAHHKEMKADAEKTKADKKTEREKFRAEQQAGKDAELKKVLSPDQFAKFDSTRTERQKKHDAKKCHKGEKGKKCCNK